LSTTGRDDVGRGMNVGNHQKHFKGGGARLHVPACRLRVLDRNTQDVLAIKDMVGAIHDTTRRRRMGETLLQKKWII